MKIKQMITFKGRELYDKGIFEWCEKTPANATKMVCPACRKISDNYEGGIVNLEGEFLENHKDEILNIIRNVKEVEMKARPLEKIIGIVDNGSMVEIKTTYEHLARRLGEAIHKAYKGSLQIQYLVNEKYTRVYWSRDA
jgi:NMD protein affecting ribosome stability and mRNA decay